MGRFRIRRRRGRNPGSRGGAVIDLIDRADLPVRLGRKNAQGRTGSMRPHARHPPPSGRPAISLIVALIAAVVSVALGVSCGPPSGMSGHAPGVNQTV